MKLSTILANVDRRQEALGLNDKELSIKAEMSGDGIRNWRRRLASEGDSAGVNANSLRGVADALGVSVEWLLSEERADPAPDVDGFSEPSVAAWIPKPGEQDRKDAILACFGASLSRAETYVARKSLPMSAIKKGDILIVDLNDTAQKGDTVLVTRADFETGEAETSIRDYVPPFVISREMDDTDPVLRIDQTGTVAVLGIVKFVVRAKSDWINA